MTSPTRLFAYVFMATLALQGALLDYRKSLVDFERVQETSLSRAGITVVSGTSGGSGTTTSSGARGTGGSATGGSGAAGGGQGGGGQIQ